MGRRDDFYSLVNELVVRGYDVNVHEVNNIEFAVVIGNGIIAEMCIKHEEKDTIYPLGDINGLIVADNEENYKHTLQSPFRASIPENGIEMHYLLSNLAYLGSKQARDSYREGKVTFDQVVIN